MAGDVGLDEPCIIYYLSVQDWLKSQMYERNQFPAETVGVEV